MISLFKRCSHCNFIAECILYGLPFEKKPASATSLHTTTSLSNKAGYMCISADTTEKLFSSCLRLIGMLDQISSVVTAPKDSSKASESLQEDGNSMMTEEALHVCTDGGSSAGRAWGRWRLMWAERPPKGASSPPSASERKQPIS